MTGDPLFRLEGVSFGYEPELPVLRDINLEIRAGEGIALLGANGCGKSTLLKLLDGLIFPTSGRILALGAALTEDRLQHEEANYAFRRHVGFVFQQADVQLFSATVREEIAFGPHLLLPITLAEERVEEVLALLGLTELAKRPPYTLSGGEQKKVALASVLAINPEILLLDEPTSGLDPRTRRWVIDLLRELGRAGKTLIVATHHLELVPEIAERAIVLSEDHRIAADGAAGEILAERDLLLRVNLVDGGA